MYEMFYVDMTGTRFNKILVLVTHVFSVKTTSLAFFKKNLIVFRANPKQQ